MKKLLMASLVLAGGSWWVGELGAHGGQYRGPGDTVPPGAGGGGGGSGGAGGGPGGPSGPTSGGPTSGGPAVPGAQTGKGKGGPTSGGSPGTDLTAWTFWWEFNKDPFINLKSAIYDGGPASGDDGFFLGQGSKKRSKDIKRPAAEVIYGKIVPALKGALESESNNDIVTGCMIALAKIGDETMESGTSEFEQIFAEFLKDSNQEIRETAALALGILANPASLPLLEGLVNDTEVGRKALGSNEVDLRTRAFAAYGLGLVGHKADLETRQRVVQIAAEALADAERLATQDVSVGLVTSIGLCPLEVGATPEPVEGEEAVIPNPWESRQAQIDFLLAFFNDNANNRFLRAHVPTAAARLLEDLATTAPDVYRSYKPEIAAALLLPLDPRKGKDFEEELQQSSAQSLGLIGDADLDDIDVKIREGLIAASTDQQRQTRKFSLMALAKGAARKGDIVDGEAWGGRSDALKALVSRTAKGKGGDERWAGLALGVYGFLAAEAGQSPGGEVAGAIREQLDKAKSTDDIAAFSVAAGVLKDQESASQLRERLMETKDPVARGYVALGLGLLRDSASIETIGEIVRESEYKPDLLKQAAIALGLLGDKAIVDDLLEMLTNASTLSTQAALASALGFIGDARSVEPLVAMLEDDTVTPTARGFAAVALGIVADKEELPWSSKIAVDVNYRASTPTLNTADGKGLLNIL